MEILRTCPKSGPTNHPRRVRRLPPRGSRGDSAGTDGNGPFPRRAPGGRENPKSGQSVQQETKGHRGRSGEPLYGIRRILLTRSDLLTYKQKVKTRLATAMAAAGAHVAAQGGAPDLPGTDRRLRTPRPARRQANDAQAARAHPHQSPLRSAGARPAQPQPLETPPRGPHLLR